MKVPDFHAQSLQVEKGMVIYMRNKISNALWGLFFIVVGIGIAGNVLHLWNFDLFFDGWWTLFIIIPCFISMIKTGFGVGSTLGFIIGVLLLMSYWVDLDFSIWSLIIPAILILIGLRIMFQGAFHRGFHYEKTIYTDGTSGPSGQSGQSGQNFSSANKSEYSAIFSSNRVHLNNEVFTGTNLNAIFGSIVLDLRDAVIQNDVEIVATAVFAGIDIYIPRGVRVKINNVPIFGGVSNKTEQYADAGAPTIYLNSTCMFGGIDIK
jgi:predicted membrane protein